jgi:hypothetical protein
LCPISGCPVSGCFIALALVLSENAWTAEDPSRRLTIGTVTEEIDRSNGGCSLQLPRGFANREGNYLFVSDFEGHALMNVDGVDTHLAFVKSKGQDVKKRGQLGEHSTYWYSGDGIEVEVDYVITGGCPSGNESCKITRYDAILAVKRGKAHKTVAAKGVCGT